MLNVVSTCNVLGNRRSGSEGSLTWVRKRPGRRHGGGNKLSQKYGCMFRACTVQLASGDAMAPLRRPPASVYKGSGRL
ncbi:hypothetical protein N7495_000223 [Penicillium taxi]|uniref:uncharacterized protein n=1 Tax=Penicillium taxi TaxID=168475 RepID=UPI0025455550|nr:uncharacterized protein N7495_000223 [Penicillium taxi]KAJ5907541.1 hypothetical protein N7495_000223 [Penicillium taxi]